MSDGGLWLACPTRGIAEISPTRCCRMASQWGETRYRAMIRLIQARRHGKQAQHNSGDNYGTEF